MTLMFRVVQSLVGDQDVVGTTFFIQTETDLIAFLSDSALSQGVVVAPFALTASRDVTKPLRCDAGGIITTTGYTLTLSGGFEAGDYQCFAGSGTVSGLKEPTPRWFGAVGDGSSDDTFSVNSALSSISGGGILNLGTYTYGISSTIYISSNQTIRGNGNQSDWNGPNSLSNFKVISNIDGPAISVGTGAANVYAVNFESFNILLQDKARTGITVDRLRSGSFRDVSIFSAVSNSYNQRGWLITTTADSGSDQNTQFCRFENCMAHLTPTSWDFGYTASGNVCHCTFIQCGGSYTTNGINMQHVDNLTWIQTYFYKLSGSGYAVKHESSGTWSTAYFYHLQGNLYVSNAAAAVFGYDMTNGWALPVVENGGQLALTTDGLNSSGWYLQRLGILNPVSDYSESYDDGISIVDNDNYGIRVYNADNGNSWKMALNSSTRAHQFFVDTSGGGDVNALNLYGDGSIESPIAGKGMILKTPDGAHRYRVSIDNSGALTSTLVD